MAMRKVSYKELKRKQIKLSGKHTATGNFHGIIIYRCLFTFSFVVKALEALFGPDFDLVTSARFLPKTVLGMFWKIVIFKLCNK